MHAFLDKDSRFLALEDCLAVPETAGVVIVPVPYEQTSSYGEGSCNGPAAILAASSQIEFFDGDLGYEPCETSGGIATLRPLRIDGDASGQAVSELVEQAVSHWLGEGKTVVTLAGEHTGVVGAVRAHVRHSQPLTVLQLDAHSDVRETYLDDAWNHACTMARVLDFHQDVVQVGIRSEAREERERVTDMKLPVFRAADIKRDDKHGRDWIAPIIEACSEDVYVTLDCDVLDPSIMPATGTPEPGGMTWEQVDSLLGRLTAERNVVGFDVSELAPIPGISHPEFTAAKLVYRFIGYLFRQTELRNDRNAIHKWSVE